MPGESSHVLQIVLGIYALSILVWLLLVERLRSGLARRHPLVHELLGRAERGALAREVAVLRFVFGGHHRLLGDARLERLCGAMRFLLVGYFLFFATLPGWLP